MSKLGPAIDIVRYNRGDMGSVVNKERYVMGGLDKEAARLHNRCQVLEDGWVKVHADLFDVYLYNDSAHAREPVYNWVNMMIMKDNVADTVSMLHDDGVIGRLVMVE